VQCPQVRAVASTQPAGTVKNMPQAVRFDHYGPVDVLEVVEVEKPTPDPGQVLVEVVSTSINPGEIAIREGAMHEVAPASFPSGQGSDLAGRVVEVGVQVGEWTVGDEVIGWTDERAAQAEFVTVPADQLIARPSSVPWDQAGSLYVAGGTARGMADTVTTGSGETAVVFAAAGGVGSILTQILVRNGVRVLAVAGPANDEWVRTVGAEPVHHGEGLGQRLRDAAPDGIDAAYDAFGDGYVELATAIGIDADRIVTIIDFDAAKRFGTKTVFGYQVTSAGALTELVKLIEAGDLTIPIASRFPLAQVREAYTQLTERHTRGKIVLLVSAG
jgi:NADPH:quinone reductase